MPTAIYPEKFMSFWDPLLMLELPNCTHYAEQTQDLCGDVVRMYAIINSGVLESLEFVADSCCMCQCAAAIVVENFRGKTVEEALAFTREDMMKLVEIQVPTSRQGCVLLGFKCLGEICGKTKTEK